MLIVLALCPTWRLGLPVAGAVLAGLVGLVLLSTRRPDALRPPQNDWLLPYLALAAAAGLATYLVRLRRAASEQRKTMLLSGAGVVVVLVCIGAIIGGRGAATPGSQGDLSVDGHDLLPFPAALQIHRIGDNCETGTGVCTEVFEASSSAGWTDSRSGGRAAAQHLRAKGSPMAAGGRAERFGGCLPIRGVFQWAKQVCASIGEAQDLTLPAGVESHNGAVVLAIAATALPDA